jgi:hypothetical protein
MARGSSNNKGSGDAGRSRIRFIVLEADLGEGELDQVTQAISNALRPSVPVVQRLIAAAPLVNGPAREIEVQDALIVDDDPDDESGESSTPSSSVSRDRGPARPRRYPSPSVLDDVDLESPLSFPDFAAMKKPQTAAHRYLVVAAWFKLHRSTDAISMNHVYTCFLHPKVKWSTAIDDFDGMLRYHKKRNRMTKAAGRGLYAINHIGLAEVEMMGSSAEKTQD